MQRLLKLAIMVLLAGMAVAVNPGVAAEKTAAAPAKTTEVKSAPPVGNTTPADGYGWPAPGAAAEKKPKPAEESSTPLTVARFIGSLALVLGLCYVTIIGLKKFSNLKSVVASNRSQIKVIESSNLGANRTLHLVEIGSKRLLVASTPTQVNLLTELEASDIPESAPEQPVSGFKEQLSQFLGTKADSTKSAKTVAQMMRDSSSHIQGKVGEMGNFRRMFRNADNG